jgi:glycosyltransferase involved in cell wall biosynthesis
MSILKHSNNGHNLSIAHFSWEYPPAIWGGLGTFATEITKKQKLLGHDVSVYAINENNKLIQNENLHGIHIYRPKIVDISDSLSLISNKDLKSWGSHITFFSDVLGYNMLSASMLLNKLRNNNGSLDILDAHDWLGILGGMMVKKSLNIPLVFHVHSTEYGRSIGGGSPTIREIEKKGSEKADGVITVSHSMKEELMSLGFQKEKIHVCWNGIDPSKYNIKNYSDKQIKQLRQSYGIGDDETLLFFIGRLVPIKGIKHLVKAMPKIISKHPKVKLLILGVGGLTEELRQIIKDNNIENKVIIRSEFIPETDRILHYAASDVVVLPSLYEPFGIVCTEAMSMQKPTIVGAHGVTGMKEQIIPEGEMQCGVHINPNKLQDIVWGVSEVLNNPDKWEQMGENARKRVFELFTWDSVATRTLEIYKEIINK